MTGNLIPRDRPGVASTQGKEILEKEEKPWAPVCDENPAPHVPEGEYVAFCKSAQKYWNPRFKREEIALQLTLCDCEYAGTKLTRYFSAKTAGKKRSNYYREWVIC